MVEKRNLIISVGREFGSGGHVIAEDLAKRFGLPIYDHGMLDRIAQEKNVDKKTLEKYDEKPVNHFFSRTVSGHSSSLQDNLAQMQFDFLKKRADAGESFVVVGRCSETVLKGYKGLITFFVLGDSDVKLRRVMDVYGLSEPEARNMMAKKNWKRKSYHNYYCKKRWGDAANYDLCINSSRLGLKGTADFLEIYIRTRLETEAGGQMIKK